MEKEGKFVENAHAKKWRESSEKCVKNFPDQIKANKVIESTL